MGMFSKLGFNEQVQPSIDWELTPTFTFTMFESWGGRDGERLRNNDEKFYYFYIDNWHTPAKLI